LTGTWKLAYDDDDSDNNEDEDEGALITKSAAES